MSERTKLIALACAVVAIVVAMIMFAHPVQATGKGLKVIVYVHNAGRFAGQEAGVTVNTSQDLDKHQQVIVPDANTFHVTFQYDPGEVAVGDEIAGCVNIIQSGISGECSSAYNGEEKEPEEINIYLPFNGNNNGGGGSSSASASNSESGSSSSASSSASINFCLINCGEGAGAGESEE